MSKRKHSDIVTMTIAEKNWNAPPSKQDYLNAKRLLKDFNIFTDTLPMFKNIGDLQKYTKQMINSQLAV